MRRYRKNRHNSDCDSLYSYSFDTPMSFGSVPIVMDEDYGINSAGYILSTTRIKSYPYNIDESEAFWIGKLLKI